MEDIIQEKISADHLYYVSLKYTRTGDVIMNLLFRWSRLIEISIDKLLKECKKKKKISKIPENNIQKIDEFKKVFKRDKDLLNAIKLYDMIRKVDKLRTEKSGEFRKNVNLKILYKGQEINVNLDKLKEYAEIIEKFISRVKQHV